MKKIAFVCQRYGTEVVGGAEAECRMYAERLTPYFDVDVFTSCALDAGTWKNHYAEGKSVINDVTVYRFRSIHERRKYIFDVLSRKIINHEASDIDEERWLKAQGPYCPGLIKSLTAHSQEYEAVLFMTYLYYPTVVGIDVPCKKKILIPTAHDEWPIYQQQFSHLFGQADALVYNAPAEKRFVQKTFLSTREKPDITIGVGVTYPEKELPSVEDSFGITGPYLCYSGRIDPGKGCDVMFRYFELYQENHDNRFQLVLTGKAAMQIPDRSDIHALGFVSEEEKYAVMKEAFALVLNSEFESLSIVVLESMMMGRPVLVNGKSEVLKDHCTLSNAGFYFYNYEEFEAELDYLLEHPAAYSQMCKNGKQYVREHYQWDSIIQKLVSLINT